MDSLFEFHKERRSIIKKEYDRVLPFNEEVTDRWEKAQFLGFGKDTSIYDSSIVMGDVTVGEGVWIGPYTLLDGTGGGLIIGNGCNISAGTQIYTHDTVKSCISGVKSMKETGNVKIGNNTYIGPMCIISKGVSIGSHCVIGANSWVNNSFEDNCIIAGTPAKQIGKVIIGDDNHVEFSYNKRRDK